MIPGRALLLLLLLARLWCEDPLVAWEQGRPQDALAGLMSRAASSGTWTAWFDAARAAREAGDRGACCACLMSAHRLAPARAEPLQMLRDLGNDLGPTWCEDLGSLAWPGSGWHGVILLMAGMGLLGLALGRGRLGRRGWSAVALVVLILPGGLAAFHDSREPWAAVVHDSSLVDTGGACLAALPAGTVVRRRPEAPWQQLIPVTTLAGQVGWMALSDLDRP